MYPASVSLCPKSPLPEVNFLFADDMIINTENAKHLIKENLLELISEFTEVKERKSIYENQLRFYTLTTDFQKGKFFKIPFTIVSKNIKCI